MRDRNLLRQIPVLRRASVVADGAGGSLRVELVRVVEDGGFGRTCGRAVVVAGDCMQELGQDGGVEVARAFLDQPEAEVDVSEESSLLRLPERRSGSELPDSAHVVQERRGEQEVVAQTRVELRSLAAQRRDSDRVLEESPRVAVVAVSACCGQSAECGPDLRVAHKRVDRRSQSLVGDLRREEVVEAVELVGVAAQGGRQRRGVGVLGGLDCPHLDLKPSSEAFDAPEDMDGVTLAEALVQELDVVPHASLDATARVGELEREVRSPVPGAPPLLLGDREHALDGPVLGELGNRGHVSSLWRLGVGTLAAMADAKPFRAVRYAGAAGPLADLVAPPYDTVDDDERAELYTRSPYNVVHMTLPESVEGAAHLYRDWLASGVLERDEEACAWVSAERYVGPDGVARERRGLIVSIAAEPFESGAVVPHERTHPRVRDDRLSLLRATRVQPESILVLTDGTLDVAVPPGVPDVEVDGTSLWRSDAPSELPGQLLIADGHHRYEAAVDLARETGEATRIMALVVSKDDPGVRLFPTHRVFADRPDLADLREGEALADLEEALRVLAAEPRDRPAAVAYRTDYVEVVRGEDGFDTELVDRHGLDGIAYTPRVDEAVAAVDGGSADVAFLVREPRVDDVFAVARRGERMPQKSTYFFPKPLSGIVFHPLDR